LPKLTTKCLKLLIEEMLYVLVYMRAHCDDLKVKGDRSTHNDVKHCDCHTENSECFNYIQYSKIFN